MLFGLDKDDDDQLHENISSVFKELGEKPRYNAVRLGLNKHETSSQPVKVSLSSSVSVQQIQRKT